MPNMTEVRDSVGTQGARLFATEYASLPFVDPLPPIPTMAATTLQLELLLQNSSVDLKAIADVILSDVGATLQILRLVGEEFDNEQDRPVRIHDCIASLNSECWYQGIRQQSACQNGRLAAEWQRCRRIGEYSRELASCWEDVSPDEAYIVGLLHRLGELPYLLGWSKTGASTSEHHAIGLMLAEFWHLPQYLTCALREQQAQSAPTVWRELLHLARQLAAPV